MTEPTLPLRQAVRALMIDHADRVLMIKLHLERNGWTGWILPGGGIEADEGAETALRRELLEETGLANAFIGPIVCTRTQRGPEIAPGFAGQQEDIYLVPCHDFPLVPALPQNELRAEGIVDMRWFTLGELHATTDKIVPEGLAELVGRVLEFGGSVEPLVIPSISPKGPPEHWGALRLNQLLARRPVRYHVSPAMPGRGEASTADERLRSSRCRSPH